jgi:hypothetical protein
VRKSYILENGLHESNSSFSRLNEFVFSLFDVESGRQLRMSTDGNSLPRLFLPCRSGCFQSTSSAFVHGLDKKAHAARALSSSSRAVLTVALAFIAKPIDVERVACQGVRNRSTIKLSCCNRASPTWNQLLPVNQATEADLLHGCSVDCQGSPKPISTS